MILLGAEVGGGLDASGSTFEAALNMDNLTVEQSLFLRTGATFKGDVILNGAKVGGQLDASGSTFGAALNMDSLTVERNLFLREERSSRGGGPGRAKGRRRTRCQRLHLPGRPGHEQPNGRAGPASAGGNLQG